MPLAGVERRRHPHRLDVEAELEAGLEVEGGHVRMDVHERVAEVEEDGAQRRRTPAAEPGHRQPQLSSAAVSGNSTQS